tara:strand:+ start:9984 stop:10205 length:222 start_codon:yes stop_codon:yes gene_type:complete
MNVFKNIAEIRSTVVGLILITLSLADLWIFGKLTAAIWEVPIQALGVVIGLLLILLPNKALGFLNKWLDKKSS